MTAEEAAARAAGWTEGGGYIYLAADWDSWKEAVSWAGTDGWPESSVYGSWAECCRAEGLAVCEHDAKAPGPAAPAEELTPIGVQLVIPGCERRPTPAGPKQGSLW